MATGQVDGEAHAAAAFCGRDEELGRLAELWRGDSGPLTLTGVVGVGKSALAHGFVANANLIQRRLDLGDLQDMEGLLGQLDASSWDGAARSLDEGGVELLLLDNVDELELARRACRELGTRLPKLRLLLTATRPLGLAGERSLGLSPLATPGPNVSDLDPMRWPALGLWLGLTGSSARSATSRPRRASFANSTACPWP